MMEIVIAQFFSGLVKGTSLFLVASGIALIFGVIGVLNFAHGSLFAIGMYAACQFIVSFKLNFWLSLVLCGITIGLLGAAMEYFFIRKVYGRSQEVAYQLLLTYAFILIFEDLIKIVWGVMCRNVPPPETLKKFLMIAGARIPLYYGVVIIMGLLITLGVWIILQKTNYGKLVRAASNDREMLQAMGVNTLVIYTSVFALGSALAGLGGGLSSAMQTVAPGQGAEITIEALICVAIAGLGSYWGAWVSAFIIGQVFAFGVLVMPRWSVVLVYLVMAVVLTFKPKGLFGNSAV